MLHFVPAWYSEDELKESEQLWYMRFSQVETDDTVKQIQLFQRNDICDYDILLLSHAPNFRHFLHRHGIYRAAYWSVFDAMQCIERKKQIVFSFHDLKWPEDIEYIYTNFCIIARLHGEKYAELGFGEYGNIIQVDLYKNNQLVRKNIYDDRGFLSKTILYENGQIAYSQYLNDKGTWKFCCYPDGHVVINTIDNKYIIGGKKIAFTKNEYESLDDLISEVLRMYVNSLSHKDIFCIAAHSLNSKLLSGILGERNLIISLFSDRNNVDSTNIFLERTDYIISDTIDNFEGLDIRNNKYKVIPPYDARIEMGISQQINVQKILLTVDNISDSLFEEIIINLIPYLLVNEKARVHLFTRESIYNRETTLLNRISSILEKKGYPAGWARMSDNNKFEFLLDEEDNLPILFEVEKCLDELSVNKCVREQRILVDLADTPDLFLQISCLSMGVPQILKNSNQYMIDGKNGRISRSIEDIGSDIGFYLDNMSNWNDAMICSYEIGRTYSADNLISQWKEVISDIEKSTGNTIRK